jgi:hypothetical protein
VHQELDVSSTVISAASGELGSFTIDQKLELSKEEFEEQFGANFGQELGCMSRT